MPQGNLQMSGEEKDEELEQNTELSQEEMDNEFAQMANKREGAEEEPGDEGLPDPKEDDPAPGDETQNLAGAEKEEEKPDFYAGLSDDQKAHFEAVEKDREKLQHRIDSDEGRVNAYQVKAEAAQKQLDDLTAGTTEKPSKEEVADAISSGPKLEAFREDYPEVAEAIELMLEKGFEKQNKKIDEVVEPILTDKAESALEDAKTQMDTDYPGWRETVKTPEFATWLQDQPEAVQSLAESDAVADASDLVGYYDTYLRANDTKTDNKDDDATDEVGERRKQQLEDGKSVDSRDSGISTESAGNADDPNNLFNFYAKKKQQTSARR